MELEVKDNGQITMDDWQLYQAKPQAMWWKRIGKPEENIFWVKGEWLDEAKGENHRVWLENRKGRSKESRRLWAAMDTNSYDPPYQVMAKEEMMELTRKAVRKMVMKPADTPQRSPRSGPHSPATAAYQEPVLRKIVVKPADTPQTSPQADVCRQVQPATHGPATAAYQEPVPVQPTASWGMQGK